MQIFVRRAVKAKGFSVFPLCHTTWKLQFDFIFDGVGNCAKMGAEKRNKKKKGEMAYFRATPRLGENGKWGTGSGVGVGWVLYLKSLGMPTPLQSQLWTRLITVQHAVPSSPEFTTAFSPNFHI